MILKLNDYIIQKPYIKLWLDGKPDWKYEDEVGPLALATGCPIILVSHYIGQLYGYTEEINNKIKRDMLFYNVETVLDI